jgi:hypothetical protein
MSTLTSSSSHLERLVVEALEPRLLFSADIAPLALAMSDLPHMGAHVQSLAPTQAAVQAASQGTLSEWVFIDSGVPDLQSFLKDFEQQAKQGRALNVVVIEAGEDGVSRISQALADQQHVGAIHIISHGSEGAVQLGATTLDAQVLRQRAGELAQWGASLSDSADLLLYGCDVAAHAKGQAFMQDLAALTGADVAASTDVTGAGGNWLLERSTGQVDTAMAVSAPLAEQWTGQLAQTTPSSKGLAVWSDASGGIPKASQWDGLANGPALPTVATNNWKIITSASHPEGRSAIVLGVDANGVIQGERWTGTEWESLPALTLVNPTSSVRQGFAVAYEQNSGNAMVVWSDGAKLQYTTYKGQGWTPATAVDTYTGAIPQRLQIAAQPKGNQLLLTVSDDNFHDRALTWDGNSWGNEVDLDSSNGTFSQQLALSPVYEAKSGNAMVVYGKANDNLIYYRGLDNTIIATPTWRPEASISLGLSGPPMTIVTAADANSNRIGLGVMSMVGNSSNVHETFARWSGSAKWSDSVWEAVTQITGNQSFSGTTVSVAFESKSGDLLAAYIGGGNSPGLITLPSNAATWSSAITGPNMGNGSIIGAIRLFADPATDHIMLGVQATSGKLTYADWDGQALTTLGNPGSTNTGSDYTPAFTWIWQPQNDNTAKNGLWLGSAVDSTGWPGLAQVYDKEIFSLDSQGLTLGANVSKGTFSHAWNPATLGFPSLDDMVWVSQPVSLLSGFNFQRGDILFTVGASTSLQGATGNVSVNNNDVVRFRPTVAGDYSSGEFTKVFTGLGAGVNGNGSTPDIRGLALVEQDVIVGDRQLRAGDFLFTAGGGGNARDIYVQSYSTAGFFLVSTTTKLLAGNDLDISQGIAALEIVTAATTLGGQSLAESELLITLDGTDTIGNNDLAVQQRDVVRLALSRTTSANAKASGIATMFLDGSAMGTPNVTLDGLALIKATSPVITSGTNPSFEVNAAENQLAVTTVSAQDTQGGSNVSYSIVGGADASMFTIDASNGKLTFKSQNVPDYEAPADANQDGVYEVVVKASEGALNDQQRIRVTVTDVNEAPAMDSSTLPLSATELSPAATVLATITAADPESQALSYSISGGVDASFFQIDSNTGQLRFINTPDTTTNPFAGHALQYQVQVAASDGTFTATRNVEVTLSKVNRPPLNTLPAQNDALEDTPLVLTGLSVKDDDAGLANLTVTFSVSAGTLSLNTQVSNGVQASQVQVTDGGKTVIIQASSTAINATLADSAGLTYLADQDANGVFTLTMVSDDGGNAGVPQQPEQRSDTDKIDLTVKPVNDAPVMLDSSTLSITATELRPAATVLATITATDIESPALTYSISGGADASFFQIDGSTGQLRFINTPDTTNNPFAGHALQYQVQVAASDGDLTATRDVVVTLNKVNRPPVNTLPAQIEALEDTPLVLTGLSVKDDDAGLANLTVTFSVNAGSLSLNTQVSNGVQASQVQVTDGGKTVIIQASSAAINATLADSAGLTYLADQDANGVFTLTMVSDDGGNAGVPQQPEQRSDTDKIDLTVKPVNDAPVMLDSSTLSITATELRPAATVLATITATDIESPALTYSISGGADASFFQIDGSTGQLRFINTPDTTNNPFAGHALQYQVQVAASDGDLTATRDVVVTLNKVNRPPVNTLPAQIEALEDTPLVLTGLSVKDDDAGLANLTVTFSVSAGTLSLNTQVSNGVQASQVQVTDGGKTVIIQASSASINATLADSAGLTYLADKDASGEFTLTMVSDDGGNAGVPQQPEQRIDTDTIELTVRPVNDAPVLDANQALAVNEGDFATLSSALLHVSDVDNTPAQLSFSLARPTGQTTNPSHGHLAFAQTPKVALTAQSTFTQAQIDAGEVIYVHDGSETLQDTLTLNVSDGAGSQRADIKVQINITSVNDAPVLDKQNSLQLDQGQRVTLTNTQLAFKDADNLPDQLSYSITTGAAHGYLALVGSPDIALTGANAFTQAQVDAGQIIYVHDGSDALADAIILSLGDGQASPIQNITLSVQVSAVAAPPTPVEFSNTGASSVLPLLTASSEATPDETRDSEQPTGAQTSRANASQAEAVSPIALMSSQQSRGTLVYTPPILSLSDTLASITLQPGSALPQVLPPKPTELKESAEDQTAFTFRWTGSLQAGQAAQALSRSLADLRDAMTDTSEHQHPLMTSSIAVSTGLSVGYVIWLVRGGALLGSMLSSMPLWNMVDPLPVLSRSGAGSRSDDATDDGDSPLENLFDGQDKAVPPPQPSPQPMPQAMAYQPLPPAWHDGHKDTP